MAENKERREHDVNHVGPKLHEPDRIEQSDSRQESGRQESEGQGREEQERDGQICHRQKLDEMKQREICAMISVGCSVRMAASYAGVPESTIRWARDHSEEFAARFRKAHMARDVTLLQNIRNAGERSWRASAWTLERLRPDVYGRKRTVNVLTPSEVEGYLGAFLELFHEIVQRHVTDQQTQFKIFENLRTDYEFMCDEFTANADFDDVSGGIMERYRTRNSAH